MGEAARRCSASSQHERAFWDTRRESEAALLLPAWGRKGPSSQRLSRGSFTAFPHPTLGTAAAIREARANRGGAATAASPRHTGSTRTSRGAGRPPLLPAWLPSTATPLLPRRALTGGGPGGAALRGPRRAVSGDRGRWLPAAVPALPGPRRAVTGGGSRSRARPLVPAHPRPRTRTAPPPLPAMREQVPQLVPRRAGQSGRSARYAACVGAGDGQRAPPIAGAHREQGANDGSFRCCRPAQRGEPQPITARGPVPQH